LPRRADGRQAFGYARWVRSKPGARFFAEADFEAAARSAVGRAGLGGPDIGLVFATLEQVTDGDATSWYAAWRTTAEQLKSRAASAAASALRESASWFSLAASDAYSRALFFVDGMPDDDVLLPTFRLGRECWDRFVELSDGRHIPLAVPYEGDSMPGYLFRPDRSSAPHPTLVVTNGSDGSLPALWAVVKPALDRGWNAFVFDGPGQQSMLFERNIPFRHDWESVLTPVLDWLVRRDEVDPDALLAYGVSQGGYWLPRALAFEHRFAGAVVDGGVWDVSVTWLDSLPAPMREVFASGNAELFNRYMSMGAADPVVRRKFAFRAKPYGQQSAFDLYTEVCRYRMADVVGQIRTPLLVVDVEDEAFFPGQPRQLYDALPGPKALAHFTAAEGANHHCEPLARHSFGLRMTDYLEGQLKTGTAPIPDRR